MISTESVYLRHFFQSKDQKRQSTPQISLPNQSSAGLNWGSYKSQLFIPCEVHRKMAVVIVAAHSYHLPDRPGYLIHGSAPEFSKHVSNSDKVGSEIQDFLSVSSL